MALTRKRVPRDANSLAQGLSKAQCLRGLDEHEEVLYARSLAATPGERWEMNLNFLRSLGCWGRSESKKSLLEPMTEKRADEIRSFGNLSFDT
jgi:hypothetical protein